MLLNKELYNEVNLEMLLNLDMHTELNCEMKECMHVCNKYNNLVCKTLLENNLNLPCHLFFNINTKFYSNGILYDLYYLPTL